jgi:hypothetical protein
MFVCFGGGRVCGQVLHQVHAITHFCTPPALCEEYKKLGCRRQCMEKDLYTECTVCSRLGTHETHTHTHTHKHTHTHTQRECAVYSRILCAPYFYRCDACCCSSVYASPSCAGAEHDASPFMGECPAGHPRARSHAFLLTSSHCTRSYDSSSSRSSSASVYRYQRQRMWRSPSPSCFSDTGV